MPLSVILLSALAVLCWGTGALFDKLLLEHVSPSVAYFVRYYVIFILLFPFLVRGWPDHKAAMQGAPRVATLFVIGSAVCYAVGMYAYYLAMGGAQASKVVPFTSVYPLVTFVLALAFLSEPFSWPKLGGTVLVVLGVAMLSL